MGKGSCDRNSGHEHLSEIMFTGKNMCIQDFGLSVQQALLFTWKRVNLITTKYNIHYDVMWLPLLEYLVNILLVYAINNYICLIGWEFASSPTNNHSKTTFYSRFSFVVFVLFFSSNILLTLFLVHLCKHASLTWHLLRNLPYLMATECRHGRKTLQPWAMISYCFGFFPWMFCDLACSVYRQISAWVHFRIQFQPGLKYLM